MVEVTKQALENNVKVSDVYQFRRDMEHSYTSLLMHALEKKETTLVQHCLRFIEDGLFTFHSTSSMVMDSFFDLLFTYSELFFPILRRNLFTLDIAEIKVPAQIFQSQNAMSNVVFTSDTILEPTDYFVTKATEELPTSESNKDLGWTGKLNEGRMVLCDVTFHYITNACKIGLNGVLRKLLMLEVPDAIFKTELIRAIISWKWEKQYKAQCWREVYTYVMFLTFFTSYAIGISLDGDRLVHDTWLQIGLSFLLLGAIILAISFTYNEYMQLKTYIKDGEKVFGTPKWGLKHYFLDSLWNLVELCSYFLILVPIPIFHVMYMFEIRSKEALFVVVAIESILAWFKVWYYAQPFEQTSTMVKCLTCMLNDILPFVSLALAVLVGFSVSLHVLFRCSLNTHSTSESEEDIYTMIHESFGSPLRSLSTLFYAMVGTLEPEVSSFHQGHMFMIYLGLLQTLVLVLVDNISIHTICSRDDCDVEYAYSSHG